MSEKSVISNEAKGAEVPAGKATSIQHGELDAIDDKEVSDFYSGAVSEAYRLKSELVAKHLAEIGMGKYVLSPYGISYNGLSIFYLFFILPLNRWANHSSSPLQIPMVPVHRQRYVTCLTYTGHPFSAPPRFFTFGFPEKGADEGLD